MCVRVFVVVCVAVCVWCRNLLSPRGVPALPLKPEATNEKDRMCCGAPLCSLSHQEEDNMWCGGPLTPFRTMRTIALYSLSLPLQPCLFTLFTLPLTPRCFTFFQS